MVIDARTALGEWTPPLGGLVYPHWGVWSWGCPENFRGGGWTPPIGGVNNSLHFRAGRCAAAASRQVARVAVRRRTYAQKFPVGFIRLMLYAGPSCKQKKNTGPSFICRITPKCVIWRNVLHTSSVIFVTEIKTRTKIIGRRFQRSRTRLL